jgi:wyosine [tRNA(Phe)-imidazoG37] synthetase (radical SAM superfamily)
MEMTFGPVPSRRLGRSLGINNIPPKICSYACVYCQVGKTIKMQVKRRAFFKTEDIFRLVKKKVLRIKQKGEPIDYLCFVPDGEPTLDIHLGAHIEALKSLDIPVAVISNGSLINLETVQNDLLKADWVSLKIDAVREQVWRRINRPYPGLALNAILDGMRRFREVFKGIPATETMLIKDLNDSEESCHETARFLTSLKPDAAYLSIPTRPPAHTDIRPAGADALNRTYQLLAGKIDKIEILSGYEGNAFSSTGDVGQDILNITAVHPMRKEAVAALLHAEHAGWNLIEDLLQSGDLICTEYQGNLYYLRHLPSTPAS